MKDINEVTHFTCHVVMQKRKMFDVSALLLSSQAPIASLHIAVYFLKTKFGFRWAREMHPRGYLVSSFFLPSGLLC